MRQRDALMADPSLWFWSPAFADTIRILHQRVSRGGTVFEIGCGLGFLLHQLRIEGFDAVALDVAEMVVDLNRADGFRVWHGTLDTLPADFVQPEAVVAFFMLHHLEDPVAMLRGVRERWPGVPLLIAQYGPSNVTRHTNLAPRNLSHWNERSLARALQIAGYHVEIRSYPSNGTEGGELQRLRSRTFERLVSRPRLYRALKRIVDEVTRVIARPLRKADFVLLAIATPEEHLAAPTSGAPDSVTHPPGSSIPTTGSSDARLPAVAR
ncbi:MAG: methyltransferase domain-containing protein [Chloroflexi bacterium]|nr:methyltransferase domain-containing protein [Chloroflexota bacterium]